MSNKKHTNYNKMSKTNLELDTLFDDVVSIPEPVPAIITGIVSACNKLNVRKKPSIDADVVCVVDEGEKLTIDTTDSANGWYRVTTKRGKYGYCMAKYITIDK